MMAHGGGAILAGVGGQHGMRERAFLTRRGAILARGGAMVPLRHVGEGATLAWGGCHFGKGSAISAKRGAVSAREACHFGIEGCHFGKGGGVLFGQEGGAVRKEDGTMAREGVPFPQQRRHIGREGVPFW